MDGCRQEKPCNQACRWWWSGSCGRVGAGGGADCPAASTEPAFPQAGRNSL
jgi:hypothetical protein